MYRTVDEFCRSVRNRARSGDLAGAFEMVVRFVDFVNSFESSVGRVFSSRAIDELCVALGRRPDLAKPQSFDENHAVFLVTGLSKTGGHSRVVRDLIAADPAPSCTILVTGYYVRSSSFERLYANTKARIEVAPGRDAGVRLHWLQERMCKLRPARTYMLQHHHDPLCVAAAQPELTGQLIYCHHCDHSLSLGVHLPHAIHVDFNAKSFFHCREVEGVKNNVIWPLTAEAPANRMDRPFLRRGCITTCSSGASDKFHAPHLAQRMPYALTYAEVVETTLRATRGTYIHIGPLPPEIIDAIEARLNDAGIAPDRFLHVPFVPDLSAALVDHDVDVYMGSFPRGGGKATVEAMAAGMPLIMHANYRSIFFTDACEIYPGAPVWRTTEELQCRLGEMTSIEVLQAHSRMARSFFEQKHAPSLLAASMIDSFNLRPQAAPERPAYFPDALQLFLDEGASSYRIVETIGTRELARLLLARIRHKAGSLLRCQ